MYEPDENANILLALRDQEPLGPSGVDVGKAMASGRRHRRTRRVAATTVLAAALAGVAVVPLILRGTAPATTIDHTAVQPTRAVYTRTSAALPTTCTGSSLPLLDGATSSNAVGLSNDGSYVSGKMWNTTHSKSPTTLWHNGQRVDADLEGRDDTLGDVNDAGVAVGQRFDGGPQPYVFANGQATRLPGELNGGATAINNSGMIVGHLNYSTAVVWTTSTSHPVELAKPKGYTLSVALDVDEDGTIVGYVIPDRAHQRQTPYVWYPNGTGAFLTEPTWKGHTIDLAHAQSVRNGWVVGLVADGGAMAGVRWDLNTGEVQLLDQLTYSAAVNPNGWVVGISAASNDAVLTDGTSTVPLPHTTPAPSNGMDQANAISDDGHTIIGHQKDVDGIRAAVWHC